MPSVVGTMTKGAVFDSVVNAADVGAINSLSEKATPVSADLLILADSADSYNRKKVQVSNLPAGSGVASIYTTSFDNGDLSSGILTITHSLGQQYCIVQVFNNNDIAITPDITMTDSNTCSVDLSAWGTISGTWNVTAIG